MENAMIEALARVYAAAYSASGVHSGMQAMTDPNQARANGKAACRDFFQMLSSGELAPGALPKGKAND